MDVPAEASKLVLHSTQVIALEDQQDYGNLQKQPPVNPILSGEQHTSSVTFYTAENQASGRAAKSSHRVDEMKVEEADVQSS